MIHTLLIVSFVVEVGAGLALLIVPSNAAELLLGEGLSSPSSLAVTRILAAALLSLGVASWFGLNGDRAAQKAIVGGMLIYNIGVPAVLIHGWAVWSLTGLALWPASLLHTVLALWCVACLRPTR